MPVLCIVARCPHPSVSGLCSKRHGGPAIVDAAPRPYGPDRMALADLLDEDRMADDMARHNARVAADPMPLRA